MEIEKVKACMKCKCKQLTPVEILEELPCMPFEWYEEKESIFERFDVYFCPDCHIIYRIQKKWYYSKKIWAFLKSLIYEEVEEKEK